MAGFGLNVVHGFGIWFRFFSPVFSTTRCITCVAPAAEAPLHEKINGTKLLCWSSKLRCCFFSFLNLPWCFWELNFIVKVFTWKNHRLQWCPHKFFPLLSKRASSLIWLFQFESFRQATVDNEGRFWHRGFHYPWILQQLPWFFGGLNEYMHLLKMVV